MTAIDFHTGVADRQAYTCRLLRKAAASGANVVVVAEPATLAALDLALWAMAPTAFIPHCHGAAPEPVRRRSAIWLVNHTQQALDHGQVLVNAGDTVPEGFAHFARLIEVVSTNEADRRHAQQRWRHYRAHGHTLNQHKQTATDA